MTSRKAGSAAVICLLATTNSVLASPCMYRVTSNTVTTANMKLTSPLAVYDNLTTSAGHANGPVSFATGSAAGKTSLGVGDYVMQGINDATTRHSTTFPPSSTTSKDGTPTTTLVDTYYTGQLLSNSIWHLFTSKTERPITPISWATPMPEIEKCWSDIVTWRNSSISWWNKYVASSKFSNSVLSTETTIWAVTETAIETTIYPTSVSAYTLCDGSPRVNVRPQTSTMTSLVTKSRTTVVPKEFAFPQTQPCVPDSHTCRVWYYESNINITNEDELLQQCGSPTGLYEPCLVAGGPVQLIYWPEDNGESDVCPNNASMALRHPSHASNISTTALPDTITALGHTFTSGSVYLSFHTLYASYDGFWDRVGPTFKDTIIPVPSSAMSTHCGGFTEAHGPATPLNYADLNWPVAASAYSCQARCDNWRFVGTNNEAASAPECKTIWNDVNPNIAIPTLVRDLVPEWAHCEMSGFRIPNFWHDPPIALTQKASIVAPTMPHTTSHVEPTQEPASPSSGMASVIPIETSMAVSETAGAVTGSVEPSAEAQPSKTLSQIDSTSLGEANSDFDPPQTSTNDDSASATEIEQESGTGAINPPQPDLSTDAPDASSSGFSKTDHTEGTVPDPTKTIGTLPPANHDKPSQTTITSPLFSYQPQQSSLDALSILESALSTFQSPDQSHATQSAFVGSSPAKNAPTGSNSVNQNPGGTVAPENPSETLPAITSAEGSESAGEASPTQGSDTTIASPENSGGPDVTSVQEPADTTSVRLTYDPATSSEATVEPTSAFPPEDTSMVGAMPSVVQAPQPDQSTLAAGDLTVTASQVPGSPDAIALGGHTLHPDGPVATISGHVISAKSSGVVFLTSGSAVAFTEVPGNPSHSLVPLVAGSLTVTAEAVAASSGAISVGGTTLAEPGDFATLEDGQTLRLDSSGIEVVRSNSTIRMSTATESTATSATFSSSTSSRTAEYPTETSATAESVGSRSASHLWRMVGALTCYVVAYVIC